jgi:hypothetical protein
MSNRLEPFERTSSIRHIRLLFGLNLLRVPLFVSALPTQAGPTSPSIVDGFCPPIRGHGRLLVTVKSTPGCPATDVETNPKLRMRLNPTRRQPASLGGSTCRREARSARAQDPQP